MLLIQHKTHNVKKIQLKKYNTHVQREVELSSPELSVMKKRPRQESVEIHHIAFQNGDFINDQLDNTRIFLFALQFTPPLHYVVYPISEANWSNPLNLLLNLKKKKKLVMNFMNDRK